jgi:hypothetical protein
VSATAGPHTPHYLGTHRDVADTNLTRFRESLARARAGGHGNVKVIERKLDDWLDYRAAHQAAGTLDEGAYL